MATFRRGMQVRIRKDTPLDGDTAKQFGFLCGAETTLVRRVPHMDTATWPRKWLVTARGRAGEPVFASELVLEPLTPPQADEWADAKVREVTKPVYTEPERVKERA